MQSLRTNLGRGGAPSFWTRKIAVTDCHHEDIYSYSYQLERTYRVVCRTIWNVKESRLIFRVQKLRLGIAWSAYFIWPFSCKNMHHHSLLKDAKHDTWIVYEYMDVASNGSMCQKKGDWSRKMMIRPLDLRAVYLQTNPYLNLYPTCGNWSPLGGENFTGRTTYNPTRVWVRTQTESIQPSLTNKQLICPLLN